MPAQQPVNENTVHRVALPFKDQTSADAVKRQLSDLSKRIDHTLQPVFRSRKIGEDLKMREPKPPLVNQQRVVYNYRCDLCDAEYVGYTSRHSHQRIDEHRFSGIGNHLKNDHGIKTIGDLNSNFSVHKKCGGKLDCLIYEMLFIKKKKPKLNTQSDSTAQNYLFRHTYHAHTITRPICYLLFTFLTPHLVYINSSIFYFLT